MKRSRKSAGTELRESVGKKPSPHGGSKGARIYRRRDAALGLLLEAFESAEELHCSDWDFALEIEELRKAGFTNSDLRWLVCKGYVEHARETRPTDDHSRSFRPTGHLTFHESTCFVLSETGVEFARKGLQQAAHRSSEHYVPAPQGNGEQTAEPVPKWDPDRLELCVGKSIVKKFQVPAANQELILSAFEEEGWPVRVDDPLPPRPNQDPKARLHTTINALNRNQRDRLIRFRGDGHGEGIRWELIETTGNGDQPSASTA